MDRQLRPGSSTWTSSAHGTLGGLAPGKGTLVEHVPVAPRVAEGARLNAVLKVVAYDAHGGVIRSWGAKARWDGPLPQHFHGDHGSGKWTWDDAASAHSVRIHAHADGSGGESVEAWAARLHATRVEIFAAPVDAVAERSEARPEEARNAPGRADDRQVEERTGGTREHALAGNDPHPPDPDPSEPRTSGPHPSGPGHDTAPTEAGWGGDGLAHAIALERELGIGLDDGGDGIDGGGDGADGGGDRSDGPAKAAREGSIPETGHRGQDASEAGQGPGGKTAKAGGDEEGSTTTRDNQGTKAGDKDGEASGAANGRYGGEGRAGDDGVRGAIALFGGLIGVPEVLKGVVELALLIEAGDITGAGGNLFKDLFKAGVGRATSVALAREIVAGEARIAAEREMRVVMKQLATKKAFTSLAREEQERVLRIVYWEKQRQFFRGYLQAAKAEQRAVRQALKNARPAQRIPLESRRATAAMGEEIAKVEPVAGRLPRNHAYAGHNFPPERLPPQYRKQGLRFKETGYPDFEPYAKVLPNGQKEVRVVYTGSRRADEAAANAAAKLDETPRGYTWHHNEDTEIMCLVPDELHNTVGHTGGRAGYKHRHGVDYAN